MSDDVGNFGGGGGEAPASGGGTPADFQARVRDRSNVTQTQAQQGKIPPSDALFGEGGIALGGEIGETPKTASDAARGTPPGATPPEEVEQQFDDDGNPIEAAADLYGIPEADVLKALREGKIPEELLEHLKITRKVDGEEEEVTLSEARERNMLYADYSRKTAAAAEARKKADTALEGLNSMLTHWTNPGNAEKTLQDFRRLGIPLQAIAQRYVNEFLEDQKLPEPVRKLKQQLIERQDRLDMLERRLGMTDETRSQTQQDMAQQRNIAVFETAVPQALQQLNLPDDDMTRTVLKKHLKLIWGQAGPLTPEHVMLSAKAAREELQQMAKRYSVTAPAGAPPAARPPLPVRPAPSSAAPGKGAPKRKGGGIAEFEAQMRQRRGY